MIISKVGQLYLKYVFHILVFVLNGYNLNLNRDYRIRKTMEINNFPRNYKSRHSDQQ